MTIPAWLVEILREEAVPLVPDAATRSGTPKSLSGSTVPHVPDVPDGLDVNQRMTAKERDLLLRFESEPTRIPEANARRSRTIVQCIDCARHVPAPRVRRVSGFEWEMPGGCVQKRTSPDSTPPIYPRTGWYCDAWTSTAE